MRLKPPALHYAVERLLNRRQQVIGSRLAALEKAALTAELRALVPLVAPEQAAGKPPRNTRTPRKQGKGAQKKPRPDGQGFFVICLRRRLIGPRGSGP
ncbi:MAG: hypothetical protein JWP58_538 [Hymenobacter sp.]|nr:hypothetical protein [Hymenobacter sp.]